MRIIIGIQTNKISRQLVDNVKYFKCYSISYSVIIKALSTGTNIGMKEIKDTLNNYISIKC
ncbi:hypothetical protein GTH52_02055 [Clostridium tyrobutyricum]|uniref:Uncharacterized protein n=1 Tax=Clostridium tyrobutyricum DIVETGP TaxID=1408889 RepID=W6N5S1_CLOTY|nr:hypothetical protein [Clostridium tyrobutyricum]CDL91636.1 hypothetical protein CTDIVETGP_1706 [Clostridium tyrobutyricum DIVETGP]AND85365.1 hypothetical protein CTK_C21150 [Clostridium tyrobutyricum]ANP69915.1 hypothetical protein BA182_09555 [Clostridium tyrobutyricum]MBV4435738.1 hypothetical protein [Clostridium tyrobutyricum]QNB65722.1 hypothetical protein GTH52_02055 [Clostridium tyrobutyricum]